MMPWLARIMVNREVPSWKAFKEKYDKASPEEMYQIMLGNFIQGYWVGIALGGILGLFTAWLAYTVGGLR